MVYFSPHLAGRSLPHHRLIRGRQVSWVQGPWAVDGHPVYGTEGGVGEVEMEASARDEKAEFQLNVLKNWHRECEYRSYRSQKYSKFIKTLRKKG